MDTEGEFIWEFAHDDSVDLFSDYNKVQYNLVFRFMQQDVFYLFHATTNEKYQKIVDSKVIKTSGGCLAGGVYCTPIEIENNGELRLHNLGSYYYLVELPEAEYARTEQRNHSKGFIFEIDNQDRKAKLLGINYMRFGHIFYRHFCKNNTEEKVKWAEEIKQKVEDIIRCSKDFILNSEQLYEVDVSYEQACQYLKEFNCASEKLTLLGYVLFEAVSQYIAYYETEEMAAKYTSKNEIYNWNYKELFFAIFPSLRVKFNLEDIYFDEDLYCDYIEKNMLIEQFDRREFTVTICKKCIQILIQECIGWLEDSDFRMDEDEVFPANLRPLVGHILHRILKEEKYRDLYRSIETSMASEVWEYWTGNDILMVYNSGMAKGEMGINPVLINQFKYRVFECKGIENRGGFYYLKKGKELEVKVQRQIIEYKESMLR